MQAARRKAAAAAPSTEPSLPSSSAWSDELSDFDFAFFEERLPPPHGEWETPSLKARERRSRGVKGGGKDTIAVTPLSSADSSLCSGRVQLTDEQRSDETTLMAEEDWSSSGTDEAPLLSNATGLAAPAAAASDAPSADAPTSPKASGSRAVPVSCPRKRPTAPRKSEAAKAPEKARSRGGIKELNDAPPMARQRGSRLLQPFHLLTSLDFARLQRAVSRGAASSAAACRGACAKGHAALIARTPQTQALLRTHAHEPWMQACFALLLLLLLAVGQHCPLPQSLGRGGVAWWVEVPLGLALALQVQEVGGRLLASLTPA